jgi:hypothetical protein
LQAEAVAEIFLMELAAAAAAQVQLVKMEAEILAAMVAQAFHLPSMEAQHSEQAAAAAR